MITKDQDKGGKAARRHTYRTKKDPYFLLLIAFNLMEIPMLASGLSIEM
jgi:hypothetical protein